MPFQIIGERFSQEAFRTYVAGIKLTDQFVPRFVTVHNTANPTLAMRPHGFTDEHITNLANYYSKERGWRGGPHCFVDDNGIWVFNHLAKPGVHSPSWNRISWGVELLGDFAEESPLKGRGDAVVRNGVAAVHTLLEKIGVGASEKTIKFHYEDPLTDHACPGSLLTKTYVVGCVKTLEAGVPQTPLPAPELWTVADSLGKELRAGVPVGAAGTGLVRAVVEAAGGILLVDQTEHRITVGRKPG